MSILIKGMEMPKNCESCPCKTADAFGGLGCQATGYIPLRKANQDRPDNCPLVPVPPHGRLIDADALMDAIESTDWYHQGENKNMVHGANSAEHQAWYKAQDIYAAVDAAPTIITADKGVE